MTDKLAEEILSDILFEHYMTKLGCMETSSGALGTFRSFKIWKEIVKAMQAYHEAKLKESKIVEAFERENQYVTDEDIKDYALRIKRRESLCTVNYYATGFIEGAIAMRNGEIKHVSRDNE